MDWLTPQLLLTIAGQLVAAGAVYGGIRADLRNHHERLQRVEEETERAHSRMDQLLMKGQHN